MRTISKLAVLLLLAIVMPASAQSTFRDAFRRFQETNPNNTLNGKTMRKSLTELNKNLIKDYDETTSNMLLDKYIEERIMDDVVDLTIEYFEGKVTVEELNELTRLLNTTDGRSYCAHIQEANKRLENFEQVGADAMSEIMAGKTPENVTEKSGIPKKYKNIFNEYYESSNLKESISNMLQSFSSLIADNDEGKRCFDEFESYMNENMPILYLNEYYGTLTIDDLKFGTNFNNTSAFKNFNKGGQNLISHSTELGIAIVTNYVTWLSNQGVELKF